MGENLPRFSLRPYGRRICSHSCPALGYRASFAHISLNVHALGPAAQPAPQHGFSLAFGGEGELPFTDMVSDEVSHLSALTGKFLMEKACRRQGREK